MQFRLAKHCLLNSPGIRDHETIELPGARGSNCEQQDIVGLQIHLQAVQAQGPLPNPVRRRSGRFLRPGDARGVACCGGFELSARLFFLS